MLNIIFIDNKNLPPGFISQIITKTLDNLDNSHKQGVKSVHIDRKLLSQELFSFIQGRKDILWGTKNIFPEVEILTEFEKSKDDAEKSENNDKSEEEESKIPQKLDTSRTESKNKTTVVTRKYFLRLSNIEKSETEFSKAGASIDYLCDWPTWLQKKYYGRKELLESESVSKMNKIKNKSAKNSKANRSVSSKKAPSMFKKMMSLYTWSTDIWINDKNGLNIKNKSLSDSLCIYHGDVYFDKANLGQNIYIPLGKKTLIYDCLDDLKGWSQKLNSSDSQIDEVNNSMPTKGYKYKSYKQMLKGTLVHTVLSKSFEEAVHKEINRGINVGRCKPFLYSSFDQIFEKEKKINSVANEQKFIKLLTIDAYRDVEKINQVFINWRKVKMNYQSELKEKYEIEKEATALMQNITQISLNKSMLKDLYHMWTEMINRNNKNEKLEIFKIIMNFTNMGQNNVVYRPSSGAKQQINTTTARIKKNFSFAGKHGEKGNKGSIINLVASNDDQFSIHHSLQRDSKNGKDFYLIRYQKIFKWFLSYPSFYLKYISKENTTKMSFEYPTSVSGQSSNKIKHKKSLPIERCTSGPNSSNGFKMNNITNSTAKADQKQFNEIYGAKNSKGKRLVTNQKSASMKVGESKLFLFNGLSWFFIEKSKDVSLPYIQSNQSSSSQTHSLLNARDVKWSPSKKKDKVGFPGASMPGYKAKKSKNKVEINRMGNSGKSSHKFVAIYSNSNQWKPK